MPSLAKQPTYSYSYSERPKPYEDKPTWYRPEDGATLIYTAPQTTKKPKTTFSYVKKVTTGGSNAASDLIAKMNEQIRQAQEAARLAEEDNIARGKALIAQAQPASGGLLSMIPKYQPETRWMVDQMLPVNPGSRGGGRPGWVSTTGIGGRTTADIKSDPKYQQYVQTYGNTGPVGGLIFGGKASTIADKKLREAELAAKTARALVTPELQDLKVTGEKQKLDLALKRSELAQTAEARKERELALKEKRWTSSESKALYDKALKESERERIAAIDDWMQQAPAELAANARKYIKSGLSVAAIEKGINGEIAVYEKKVAATQAYRDRIESQRENRIRQLQQTRDRRGIEKELYEVRKTIASLSDPATVTAAGLSAELAPELVQNAIAYEQTLMGMLGGGQPAQQQQMTPEDQQALDWANANPNDPRAAQIKAKFGM